jgi:hypothetical protein
MAIRSTEPLTEISTRNLPRGKGRPARKADNLTVICEPIVYKMWETPQPVTGIGLPFFTISARARTHLICYLQLKEYCVDPSSSSA